MTRLHAARVAARLRKALRMDVAMIHGPYGRFQVLVDDEVIVSGGVLGALGILPSPDKVLEGVRGRLSAGTPPSEDAGK